MRSVDWAGEGQQGRAEAGCTLRSEVGLCNGWRETWRAAASVFTACTVYSLRAGGATRRLSLVAYQCLRGSLRSLGGVDIICNIADSKALIYLCNMYSTCTCM